MAAAAKKVVFVTGGNTGLGLEIVRALYKSTTPYEIVIGSRQVPNGETAVATLQKETPASTSSLSVVQADLTSDTSLEAAVAALSERHGRLDVLVNNGGVALDGEAASGKRSVRDVMNAMWDVNVAGTQVLTQMAMPLLVRSSDPRLLFITSGTSSISETERTDRQPYIRLNSSPEAGWPKPPSFSLPGYRSSKAGLNMIMREWHRVLLNDGVKVWSISPGMLATNLGGLGPEQMKAMGAIEPYIGGEFVRDVIQGKRDEFAGKVIRSSEIQPY